MRARLKEQRFRQEWEYKFRLGLDRFRIGFAEIRRYEHRFRIVSIYIYVYIYRRILGSIYGRDDVCTSGPLLFLLPFLVCKI